MLARDSNAARSPLRTLRECGDVRGGGQRGRCDRWPAGGAGAGPETGLGDLPLEAARSPDARHLRVSNDGQGTQSLQVIDVAGEEPETVQTVEYRSPEALYIGVAYSPDGRHAYASAGGNNKIR